MDFIDEKITLLSILSNEHDPLNPQNKIIYEEYKDFITGNKISGYDPIMEDIIKYSSEKNPSQLLSTLNKLNNSTDVITNSLQTSHNSTVICSYDSTVVDVLLLDKNICQSLFNITLTLLIAKSMESGKLLQNIPENFFKIFYNSHFDII